MRRHDFCRRRRSLGVLTLLALALVPAPPALARVAGTVVDLRTAPSWLATGATSIGPVGDVNGDGIDDVALADCRAGDETGAVRVVWGLFDRDKVTFDDPGAGFMIFGAEPMDYACNLSMRPVGDVNGDGLADVLVAADRYYSGAGTVYVVFGKSGTEPVYLREFNESMQGDQGYVVSWHSGMQIGVAGLGDMNEDGLADFVVGGGTGRGAYVVFGQTLPTPVDLRTFDAGAGHGFFIRHLCRECFFGFAGDVNGDGTPDVGVGGVGRKRYEAPGSAYVVFGKSDPLPVDTTDGPTPQFFKVKGNSPGGFWGGTISGAGVINGDGLDDVVIGIPRRVYAKAVVIFGKTDTETIWLEDLGDQGFQILAGQANDSLGTEATGIGDVDGDGFADIAIGAYHHRHAGRGVTGAVFLVYGGGRPRDLRTDRLGKSGYVFVGRKEGDVTGHDIGAPGDMNGDGVPDLMISAPIGENAHLLWL